MIFSVLMISRYDARAQCTFSNGTGCLCADGSDTCLLLPDIVISETAITEPGGYAEYAQTGNTLRNGQFRVTGATPNIGRGPLHIMGTDTFVCGADTIISATPPNCPDGSLPGRIIQQRIYRKEGTAITSFQTTSGTMRYHGSGHDHFHVDDWFHVSLRIRDSIETDPRKWPALGEGAKISFCLADFKPCTQVNGYCRDNTSQVLDSSNMANFGMGGNYNTCTDEQGISVGYMDIYDLNISGMNLTIPYGTCNGEYWIVAEVDPYNHIMESNDSNNLIAVPVTLIHQSDTPVTRILAEQGSMLCNALDTIVLKAGAGLSYVWSTGETTRHIAVSQPGSYTVAVTTHCGVAYSDTLLVALLPQPLLLNTRNDTLCAPGNATLTASGTGGIYWYDDRQNLLLAADTLTTPVIDTTTVYYAAAVNSAIPDTFNVGKINKEGNGNYYPGGDHIRFNAYQPLTIQSVKVYADSARFRTIKLRDIYGEDLASTTVFVPAGEQRITIGFEVPAGNDYRLFCYGLTNLWRDVSFGFPYLVPNVIELIGTGLDDYYAYLYDWEVITNRNPCITEKQMGPEIPVYAFIGNRDSLYITGLDTAYFTTDPAANMTGFPSGGVFSGPGVSGSQFDPAAADTGTHLIRYTFTDGFGCTDSTTTAVKIKVLSSAQHPLHSYKKIHIYPNPSEGPFTIACSHIQPLQYVITDHLGRKMTEGRLESNGGKNQITLVNLPAGTYIATFTDHEDHTYIQYLLKQ